MEHHREDVWAVRQYVFSSTSFTIPDTDVGAVAHPQGHVHSSSGGVVSHSIIPSPIIQTQ